MSSSVCSPAPARPLRSLHGTDARNTGSRPQWMDIPEIQREIAQLDAEEREAVRHCWPFAERTLEAEEHHSALRERYSVTPPSPLLAESHLQPGSYVWPRIARERKEFERRAARERVANGTGAIFFQHVRKAGGTSLKEFLRSQYAYNKQPSVQIVHSEFAKIHSSCMHTVYNSVAFVTSLRHPVCRALSEFVYVGFGTLDTRTDGCKANFSAKRYFRLAYKLGHPAVMAHVTRNMLLAWLDNSHQMGDGDHLGELAGGIYRPNTMIRSFGAGDCRVHVGFAKECAKDPPAAEAVVGNQLPRLVTCTGRNNTRLDASRLEAAKDTLRQFDGILIVEWLKSRPDMFAAVQLALDGGSTGARKPSAYPHSNQKDSGILGSLHTCSADGEVTGIDQVTRGNRRAPEGIMSILSRLSFLQGIVSRLFEENKLDIEFYEYAKRLVEERISAYQKAKQEVNFSS